MKRRSPLRRLQKKFSYIADPLLVVLALFGLLLIVTYGIESLGEYLRSGGSIR